MVGLGPYLTVKSLGDMFSGVDRIPACDRRTARGTDGQTSCDSIVLRAMHTRRAVKTSTTGVARTTTHFAQPPFCSH